MVFGMVLSVPLLISFLTPDLQASLRELKPPKDNHLQQDDFQDFQNEKYISNGVKHYTRSTFHSRSNDMKGFTKFVPSTEKTDGYLGEPIEFSTASGWNHVKKDLKDNKLFSSSSQAPNDEDASTVLEGNPDDDSADISYSRRKVKRSSEDLKDSASDHQIVVALNRGNFKDSSQISNFRSARSASQEQWIKQPYPVHSENGNQDRAEDAEATDNVRAPKVHFVTQKRPENNDDFRNFDRSRDSDRGRIPPREMTTGRSRDFIRDSSLSDRIPERYKDSLTDQENDKLRERAFDRRGFYDRGSESYRPMRDKYYNFSPYNDDYHPSRRPFGYYPSENTYQSSYQSLPPRKRYGRRNERYRHFEYERETTEKPKKQTRIIYYATLPEVARSPPKVDLRDRFNYRYDNYMDDPYFRPPGRFREPYPPPKAFYDNGPDRLKPLNSGLKFSKDISVKEPKKAPESRIYSEAERRYADDFERFPQKTV